MRQEQIVKGSQKPKPAPKPEPDTRSPSGKKTLPW